MRHHLTHFAVTENLPDCTACGAATVFTSMAETDDSGSDKHVYLVFRCSTCGQESRVWRPEWQSLADSMGLEPDHEYF